MASYGKYDLFKFSDLTAEEREYKNRSWVFIVYPESAPDDWVDQIRELHLPMAISPLHDKDVNETGEPKKPHYHVILSFDGPTTYKNANNLVQRITNGPIVKPCHSIRGSYRYFTHMDNPEKFQYDDNEIRTYNSFEVALTETDEDFIKRAIVSIILVNRIQEYAELMIVLEFEFGTEFARVARRNHAFISSVVTSIRHNPGATYKRFMHYVSPETFNLYAMNDDYMYHNSKEHIEELIRQYDAIHNKEDKQ